MSAFRFSLVLGCCLVPRVWASGAEPAPAGLVSRIKVVSDKAPDCTSLKSIAESVTRGCRTNDEKAIAIYNFMRLTHYHRAYPSEGTDIPVLKEINCYGWSLCGGLHAEQSALWRELGWNWRFVGWPGHTTVEAFYDDRWHYLDVFLKFYTWMPDPKNPGRRTIAGQDDIAADPKALLFDAFTLDKGRKVAYFRGNEFELFGERANWQAPAFLVCGDDLPGIADGVKKRSRAGSPEGWAGMAHATGKYSADVNLAPGCALTNTWDPSPDAWYWRDSKIAPCHTCGDKEIRNSPEKGPVAEPYFSADWKCESYANGQLSFRPDLSSEACLRSFAAVENVTFAAGGVVPADAGKPARVTVLLQSPYVLTQAHGSADGVAAFEVSTDGGKTWKAADLNNFTAPVKGQLQALARFTIKDRLKNLDVRATVQNNPFALPFLAPGKNTITVSVADPAALGDNKLVVTYAYRPGERRKSYEQLCLEGKEIARGHDASWDTKPVVVQKVFAARDLPATFDIDVATATDKHPVYPRMLFVRREVVAPNQKPLPLPKDAQEPKSGPGFELKSLPNPLLVGTQPAPVKVVRPVKTLTLELTANGFVSKPGDAATGDFLRWPKNANEKVESVAFLVGGELKGLPALKDLAAARLVVPAVRAHDKAPTKLGVTALQAPLAAGQAFDFGKLGDVVGSVAVPVQPADAATWSPPKEFKVDVTRTVRSVITGDTKFHGFGLRVVPDRGTDDGYTVRVQLPKQPKVVLEVDVYTDPAK
ncbi:CARDB domain lipoprotein, putative OS=Geobacter metallireducens (strain GS-15 / ATCC 53774 / DSM 7210) GN=Gmet_1998 PE=1 SV=1 [Gemmataceae bacterium]|nr:CARDB domain lipoprotein, putative OS=Geobacter metallireducens (strain GS-15 / ATCC 53774 / DSM 7210) GN=Gmet_1998 PE=1 SV=1 [Gemmataceae bacterium]VTU00783.1 CARDB domain lipoprotein, putative OS=Geobacter metallireducens (strain GS-15 / ATCC 53774 / DSM 7210) GN=Gmet_1998 PE=1 SV=1 [Gemmataceae bacterium]